MIYAIYIAAAAVVGVLIGFVVLSVTWLKRTVAKNIRSKTTELISVYDDLLEEKSRELAALEAKQATIPQQSVSSREPETAQAEAVAATLPASEMLGMAERSGGAVYRDDTVGKTYLKIRENFSFRMEELLAAVSDVPKTQSSVAGRLLEQLDYDTIFHLATMDANDQVAILKGALPTEEACLLEDYLAGNKTFCILEFYDHLRALADAESKAVRLRVPVAAANTQTAQAGVEIVPDEEICEGFQMEADQVLYDYCIRAKELR